MRRGGGRRHMTTGRLSARERLELVLKDPDVSLCYPPSYGRAIWDVVRDRGPTVMIEFGVYRGYSTIIAALAMEEIGSGHVKAYDSWEEARREGSDDERLAIEHFTRYGVRDRILLQTMDFLDWIRDPERCDLLYFDIDNDGDKLQAMFEGLRAQIAAGLTVLFEGGSEERDLHDSVAGRRPIGTTQALTGYRIIVEEFPSLSVISHD
jgi:predicted O-methyltransferase YrrM